MLLQTPSPERPTTPSRWKRRLAGSLVFIVFFGLMGIRLFWGLDRSEAALDRAFTALARAVTAPPAERGPWLDRATDAFSTASGNALGAALPIFGLEVTARLRDGTFDGVEPALRPIFVALHAGDIRGARDLGIAWRDSAAPTTPATRDAQAMVSEFLQQTLDASRR
jgi:hypothetical protein